MTVDAISDEDVRLTALHAVNRWAEQCKPGDDVWLRAVADRLRESQQLVLTEAEAGIARTALMLVLADGPRWALWEPPYRELFERIDKHMDERR